MNKLGLDVDMNSTTCMLILNEFHEMKITFI